MILEMALLGLTALAAFAWYIKAVRWNYWAKLGVYQIPGFIPYKEMLMTKHFVESATECYRMAKGNKVYGYYFLFRPVLNIADPDLLKTILVRDFDSFVDRGPKIFSNLTDSVTDQIWSRQITMLTGDLWKDARQTFSPIFTSGKMKAMKVLMDCVAVKLVEAFEERTKAADGVVDLKDLFGRFSMDTIALCAFGIDSGSFSSGSQGSTFVTNAAALFQRRLTDVLKIFALLMPFASKIMSLLGISILKPKETQFFYDIVRETLRVRREEGKNAPKRNDLIDLMLAVMKEDLKSDNLEEQEDQFEKDAALSSHRVQRKPRSQEHEELDIVATAFTILVAGYDTTSLTLSYAGYELAKNPDVQRQLQDEIDAAYDASDDDKLDYATIQTLPYLDMVFHETVRLHPALGLLQRACTKDGYKVPGTNIVLNDQDSVDIPVYGIHTDPDFYPDPFKFDPERFSKEAKAARNPYLYLGFGQGPRSCLGMRFAVLEAKVALASIVRNFEFQVCDKTVSEIRLDPKNMLSGNIGGIWVRAVKRN